MKDAIAIFIFLMLITTVIVLQFLIFNLMFKITVFILTLTIYLLPIIFIFCVISLLYNKFRKK